jgi:hypothetical protein
MDNRDRQIRSFKSPPWDSLRFGLARDGALYPLACGCRAPRRIMPELEATAPPIPFWFYRGVAGAAERRAESGPSFGRAADFFLT